jgi:uncharacterized membrane protein YeaQ/YmgE (transglycosylase-associated protein family)
MNDLLCGWVIGIIWVWLICIIAGALISQSKNRPPWEGALCAALLGIIGVVILACLNKNPAKT